METEILEKSAQKKRHKRIHLRPIHFIALGFIAVIFVGSFLLSTPIAHENRQWFNYSDALFTSTSAVCVTGLSVVDTATQFSTFGEIVIMLLIQVGGLGFMTFASLFFLMVGKRISLKDKLTMQEAYSETKMQGLGNYTKIIVLTALGVELLGMFMLMISFVPMLGFGKGTYYSLFHSISAFCNAGFDIMGNLGKGTSLTSLQTDVMANISIMSLITLGGLGFAVLKDAFSKRPSKWSLHTKIVIISTVSLLFGGAFLFALFEWNNPDTIGNLNVGQKILASFFLSVTPRTAGFATVDMAKLTSGGTALTMFYMFIGASPASTGGGIKTTTFVILIVVLFSGMKGNKNIVIAKRQLNAKAVIKAVSVLIFALLLIAVCGLLICGIEKDMSVIDIYFESVSAFCTVGLTRGITPDLSVASKLILGLLMLYGRLGTISLGLFYILPRHNENLNIKYNDANINVG